MFLKTECFISNDLVNKLSILILFLVGHFKTRYTGGVVVILFRNTPLPPRNFSFYFITLAWLGNFIRQKTKLHKFLLDPCYFFDNDTPGNSIPYSPQSTLSHLQPMPWAHPPPHSAFVCLFSGIGQPIDLNRPSILA